MSYEKFVDLENETHRCGCLPRIGLVKALQDEKLSTIMSRIEQRIRASHLQLEGMRCEIDQRKRQVVAHQQNGDIELAKTLARTTLNKMEIRKREIAKHGNLITLLDTLREAQRNAGTAHMLKSGSLTLGQLLQNTPNVENIIDNIREQIEDSHEIGTLLSESIATQQYDDDEIFQELLGTGCEIEFPDVPTTIPEIFKEKEREVPWKSALKE